MESLSLIKTPRKKAPVSVSGRCDAVALVRQAQPRKGPRASVLQLVVSGSQRREVRSRRRVRISDRDREILYLLWQCGQVATSAQLTHQEWDQGKDNTRFRESLRKLVELGYMEAKLFPKDMELKAIGKPKYYYRLKELGAGVIGKSVITLDSKQEIEHLLKSEFVRQFNERGYVLSRFPFSPLAARHGTLVGCACRTRQSSGQEAQGPRLPDTDSANISPDIFYFYGDHTQIFVVWDAGRNTRSARAGLRKILEIAPDPTFNSLVFVFTERKSHKTFCKYVTRQKFKSYSYWNYSVLPLMAQEKVLISANREAVPFDGWYRHQCCPVESLS